MMNHNKVSIVILTYNNYSYVHQLLMDIKQHCQDAYEVIVVDNASEDPNVENGLGFWVGMNLSPPLKVYTLHINRGFVGGMNYGLKMATGDIVILLSNDVRIHTDELVEQVVFEIKRNEKVLIGANVYTHDTGWNCFNDTVYPYAEGWFLAATKDAWEDWDGFDERYAPSDYEDIHLSTRAIREGYRLIRLKPGIVEHLGARTYGYNPERLERTQRNREIFKRYWGIDG